MLTPQAEGRIASFLTFASVELITLSDSLATGISRETAAAISRRLRALAQHIDSINTGPEMSAPSDLPDANTESPKP